MKKIEREDWFTAGLKILSKAGFQKITIENLCETLKVTKGSFYHHFKNTDAYVEALMNYWMTTNTKDLIQKAEKAQSPQEKIDMLNKLVLKRSNKSEQVIRGWSFSNKIVRRYLVEADKIRLEHTSKLKLLCGEKPQKAKQLAILEYACLIGLQQLYPDMTSTELMEFYKLFNEKRV